MMRALALLLGLLLPTLALAQPVVGTGQLNDNSRKAASTAFVNALLAGKADKTPSDNTYYVQRNGGWVAFPGVASVPPNDGQVYGVSNGVWAAVGSGGTASVTNSSVIAALGYTPANKAGDTFAGPIQAAAASVGATVRDWPGDRTNRFFASGSGAQLSDCNSFEDCVNKTTDTTFVQALVRSATQQGTNIAENTLSLDTYANTGYAASPGIGDKVGFSNLMQVGPNGGHTWGSAENTILLPGIQSQFVVNKEADLGNLGRPCITRMQCYNVWLYGQTIYPATSQLAITTPGTTPAVGVPSTWAASTAYSIGSAGAPIVKNGTNYYYLAQAGTSGSTGPTGTTPGTDITDGTAVWRWYDAEFQNTGGPGVSPYLGGAGLYGVAMLGSNVAREAAVVESTAARFGWYSDDGASHVAMTYDRSHSTTSFLDQGTHTDGVRLAGTYSGTALAVGSTATCTPNSMHYEFGGTRTYAMVPDCDGFWSSTTMFPTISVRGTQAAETSRPWVHPILTAPVAQFSLQAVTVKAKPGHHESIAQWNYDVSVGGPGSGGTAGDGSFLYDMANWHMRVHPAEDGSTMPGETWVLNPEKITEDGSGTALDVVAEIDRPYFNLDCATDRPGYGGCINQTIWHSYRGNARVYADTAINQVGPSYTYGTATVSGTTVTASCTSAYKWSGGCFSTADTTEIWLTIGGTPKWFRVASVTGPNSLTLMKAPGNGSSIPLAWPTHALENGVVISNGGNDYNSSGGGLLSSLISGAYLIENSNAYQSIHIGGKQWVGINTTEAAEMAYAFQANDGQKFCFRGTAQCLYGDPTWGTVLDGTILITGGMSVANVNSSGAVSGTSLTTTGNVNALTGSVQAVNFIGQAGGNISTPGNVSANTVTTTSNITATGNISGALGGFTGITPAVKYNVSQVTAMACSTSSNFGLTVFLWDGAASTPSWHGPVTSGSSFAQSWVYCDGTGWKYM